MQPPVFIARLMGPYFVVAGIGMLLNQAAYAAMIAEFVHSNALIFISGVLSLPAGLAILNVHRAWTADWRVIVTILGWLAVIGGVLRLVLPQVTAMIGSTVYAGSAAVPIFAVIALVLGGFLSVKGYRA
ncbi:MAG: hypothetical protein ABSF87_11675 [Xanthobacteraceae bacterium]|jgi:hypothetical protein